MLLQPDFWRKVIHRKISLQPELCLPQKAKNADAKGQLCCFCIVLFVLVSVVGCSRGTRPTRTPVPTWTPTPVNGETAAGSGATSGEQSTALQAEEMNEAEVTTNSATQAEADQNVGPTPQEQFPAVVDAVTATFTPENAPTATPLPTDTPVPTEAPTATPAPPEFEFELESVEKFPTDSLAENVVRIYLYVYADGGFALPDYSLTVKHDGAELPVEAISTAGLPEQTRAEPSPHTRFTNMNSIFIEPQGGIWEIQLIARDGTPAGPVATMELAQDDSAREIYVRYKRK